MTVRKEQSPQTSSNGNSLEKIKRGLHDTGADSTKPTKEVAMRFATKLAKKTEEAVNPMK
eukprot:5965089-Ditylum_brightwellii.AAC.1